MSESPCGRCGGNDWYVYNSSVKRQRVCRPCKLAKNREWDANNRARRVAIVQRYQKKNPTAGRNTYLLRTYGISLDDFNELLASQGGVCAICGSASPKSGHNWHVDHDHVTGSVRGILCHSCNTCLGFVEDSQEVLSNMITYLAHGGQALRERVGL